MSDGSRAINVLVILGHPRANSLCAALAHAYRIGGEEVGMTVRQLVLADLAFERDVLRPSPRDQALEPDLEAARQLIAWADHLVLVYPVWWGTMPGLMKSFLDRILVPGFAFEHTAQGGYRPLLTGKTAELIMTMDTPSSVYRWIYRAPSTNALKRATLQFCGIRTLCVRRFGSVVKSAPAQRARWIASCRRAGTSVERLRIRSAYGAWLRALRLQFYPMAWVAYAIGALAAGGRLAFSDRLFWTGLAALAVLEAATVLTNEVVDLDTDRLNRLYGPFNGGSRVLVEGAISVAAARVGIGVALGLLAATLTLLARSDTVDPAALIVTWGALTLLALGYTAPPIKLSYRSLGELDVALTHSIGAILCGYVLQGGSLGTPTPWLLGLPMFLAIVPAITLSTLPDLPADSAVGKRTLAVRFGPGAALTLSMICTTAAATVVASPWLGAAGAAYRGAAYLVVPYAAFLLALCLRYALAGAPVRRIDGLVSTALGYIVCFCAFPFAHLIAWA